MRTFNPKLAAIAAAVVPAIQAGFGPSVPASCTPADPALFIQRDVNNDLVTMSACVDGHYVVFWRAEHFADRVMPMPVPGTTNCFRLPQAPKPATSLMLVLGGSVLFEDVDYTLDGQIVTFRQGASLPGSGAALLAWYRY